DVATLSTLLISLDVTLAALFWSMDSDTQILARLVRKVLYVGAFAYIIGHFADLSAIIYDSFSRLGLDATQNTLQPADLLRPGKLAGVGFTAAFPLLVEAGKLMGFTTVFNHIVTIIVLVGAWFIVVLAFFVLAVQLFITVLEFKLTTLAGFVLVPFAFWNKTAFLAERVLGNVVASGVKVMVLAVIVAIGSNFFSAFIQALNGHDPALADAMSLVLAALALLGLGIFGPSIASGLVSAGPQLGAGAMVGTVGAAAGTGMLMGGAAVATVRAVSATGLAAMRSAATLSEGARKESRGGAMAMPATKSGSGETVLPRTHASPSSSSAPSARAQSAAPAWAVQLRSQHRRHAQVAALGQALRAGDGATGGAMPHLGEEGR
ncbi:MAG: P-type conjugative transfer protein TrbL, partial [Alphaproteobacteria bacterium]|nr:P-type conjugative transfer protein TrbL [Alphaproteobacteria bacterium]